MVLPKLAAASKAALEHDMDLACLGNVYSEKIDQGFSVFPNNDDDEMRATFSHLIYLGDCRSLDCEEPASGRCTARGYVQPPNEYAGGYYNSTHVDVNFMRAKSIRLFAETRQLTSTWNGSASSPSPPALWFDRYWKLIEQIHSHIGLLQPAALKVSYIPDYHNVGLSLKHSMILALAALADLHAIFAPSHPESSRRYRGALTEIVSISSTFSSDDFQYRSPSLSFTHVHLMCIEVKALPSESQLLAKGLTLDSKLDDERTGHLFAARISVLGVVPFEELRAEGLEGKCGGGKRGRERATVDCVALGAEDAYGGAALAASGGGDEEASRGLSLRLVVVES
ncbi:hypothetical protein C8J57DRAFT_1476916 [Mycena rebaudengoi]|nr:hypothetical protein C8J57DRAFT_1476916 [Mycena rebaudengoi]